MGRGYGGRLRPPLGPGQRPGRGFRGAKPPEKIWVFRDFKGNFLLNSDTYLSPKMARNTLKKILEIFFLFSWSLRFYLFFKLELHKQHWLRSAIKWLTYMHVQTFLTLFCKFYSQKYPHMCTSWLSLTYQLIKQSLGVVHISWSI